LSHVDDDNAHDAQRALAAMRSWPSLRAIGEIVVCHGSLRDAAEYVSTPALAARALDDARAYRRKARLLVCGHTHAPVLFSTATGVVRPAGDDANSAILSREGPWLLNPGSVGQARDGTTLARYALVDDELRSATFRSVAYDFETTIAKERAAGLVPSVMLDAPRTALERQVARGSAAAARVVVRLGADVLLQRARERTGGRSP
jgi:diadenosine tetraphosphatase ApaH/serine/threonine PP2A family protein phosphatase